MRILKISTPHRKGNFLYLAVHVTSCTSGYIDPQQGFLVNIEKWKINLN